MPGTSRLFCHTTDWCLKRTSGHAGHMGGLGYKIVFNFKKYVCWVNKYKIEFDETCCLQNKKQNYKHPILSEIESEKCRKNNGKVEKL